MRVKCCACSVKKYNLWTISNKKDIKFATKVFKKKIVTGYKFCRKCKLKVTSSKGRRQFNIHSSSSEGGSPDCLPIDKIEDYVELDVPALAYTERYCLICHNPSSRSRIPKVVRFNTYLNNNLYIHPNTRCCTDHFFNNTLYENCLKLVSIVANTAVVLQADFKWILNESLRRNKENSILSSFNNKSISTHDCHSLTGLTLENFFDLASKLHSLKQSKNRTVIEALLIFLFRLKTNNSLNSIATLFSIRNESLVGHICDEVQKSFECDITGDTLSAVDRGYTVAAKIGNKCMFLVYSLSKVSQV